MSRSLLGYRWTLPKRLEESRVREVSLAYCLDPALAEIVLKRAGLNGVDRYLKGALKDLRSPLDLPGMEAATDRIVKAIKGKETILMHGDFDADGISALALLHLFFKEIGVETLPFVPDRLKDGHGISTDSLAKAKSGNCSLMVTCDVGVSSKDMIDKFLREGIETVVTDHHIAEGELPKAYILNPYLSSHEEFKVLAGVGVAFCLVASLRSRLRAMGFFSNSNEPDLRNYLDLVALGTVADVCPLTGENRILVKYGLDSIRKTTKSGLKALLAVSMPEGKCDVDSHDIAFRLAPRINAAGRLGKAMLAFELLTTEDDLKAQSLARELDRLNIDRKKIEENMFSRAKGMVESGDFTDKRSFCIAGRNWHKGLLGLVAGKLAENYGKTFAVISVDEEECRGSVRTIEPMNAVEILKELSGYLMKFGGHSQAGGFSILEREIEGFSKSFVKYVQDKLEGSSFEKELKVDGTLSLSQINAPFMEDLNRLEPFGPLNERPNFLSMDVGVRQVYENQKYTRFIFARPNGDIEGVVFKRDLGKKLKPPFEASVVFTPEINCYGGNRNLRLVVKDIKA